jgi:hypothetical protein
MSVSWDQVEKEWLFGQSISLDQAEVLARFKLIEDTLGAEYLIGLRTGGLTPPILRAMLLADKLRTISDCEGTGELLAKVKQNEPSAYSELTAAFLLRVPGTTIEFGPEVSVKTKTKRPDFRIKSAEGEWLYVEVASPNESELQRKAQLIVGTLAKRLAGSSAEIVLDCILLKEPSAKEIDGLCDDIGNFVRDTSPSIHNIPELCVVAINQTAPGQAVINDYGAPSQTRIAVSTFLVDAGQTKKTVTVRIPFEDKRAAIFITHEARQLPIDSPGLVMFDMNAATTGTNIWQQLIRRRLQPRQHTRVSAVCLFTGNFMLTEKGLGWFPHAVFIRNEYARITIPEWIQLRLESMKYPDANHG